MTESSGRGPLDAERELRDSRGVLVFLPQVKDCAAGEDTKDMGTPDNPVAEKGKSPGKKGQEITQRQEPEVARKNVVSNENTAEHQTAAESRNAK